MCGVPIVGYDVGGSAETVSHERGIFVPYGAIDKPQKGINLLSAIAGRKRRIKKTMYAGAFVKRDVS